MSCPQLLLKLDLLSVEVILQHLCLFCKTCILHAELTPVFLQLMLVMQQGLIPPHSCNAYMSATLTTNVADFADVTHNALFITTELLLHEAYHDT